MGDPVHALNPQVTILLVVVVILNGQNASKNNTNSHSTRIYQWPFWIIYPREGMKKNGNLDGTAHQLHKKTTNTASGANLTPMSSLSSQNCLVTIWKKGRDTLCQWLLMVSIRNLWCFKKHRGQFLYPRTTEWDFQEWKSSIWIFLNIPQRWFLFTAMVDNCSTIKINATFTFTLKALR